jgi:hypothetical protein
VRRVVVLVSPKPKIFRAHHTSSTRTQRLSLHGRKRAHANQKIVQHCKGFVAWSVRLADYAYATADISHWQRWGAVEARCPRLIVVSSGLYNAVEPPARCSDPGRVRGWGLPKEVRQDFKLWIQIHYVSPSASLLYHFNYILPSSSWKQLCVASSVKAAEALLRAVLTCRSAEFASSVLFAFCDYRGSGQSLRLGIYKNITIVRGSPCLSLFPQTFMRFILL